MQIDPILAIAALISLGAVAFAVYIYLINRKIIALKRYLGAEFIDALYKAHKRNEPLVLLIKHGKIADFVNPSRLTDTLIKVGDLYFYRIPGSELFLRGLKLPIFILHEEYAFTINPKIVKDIEELKEANIENIEDIFALAEQYKSSIEKEIQKLERILQKVADEDEASEIKKRIAELKKELETIEYKLKISTPIGEKSLKELYHYVAKSKPIHITYAISQEAQALLAQQQKEKLIDWMKLGFAALLIFVGIGIAYAIVSSQQDFGKLLERYNNLTVECAALNASYAQLNTSYSMLKERCEYLRMYQDVLRNFTASPTAATE